MNLSKGWALTLGVFLGYQVAKLRDHMPMIVQSVMEMRELVQIGQGARQVGDAEWNDVFGSDDDEDEGDVTDA